MDIFATQELFFYFKAIIAFNEKLILENALPD